MTAELSRDEVRAKLEPMRDKWKRAVGKARKANMEAGAERKKAHDGILSQAERIFGIPKRAFRLAMTQMDHVDEATDHREKVLASEDDALIKAYDTLILARGQADMPLFPPEMIEEMEASAARELDEEEESDKVTSLTKRRRSAAKKKAGEEPQGDAGDDDDDKTSAVH